MAQPIPNDFATQLRMFLSQSRAPHSSPHKTSEKVKDVINELHEQLSITYHRLAGGRTILYELQKRKDLVEAGYKVPQSSSTITSILKERGYIHTKQKKKRQLLDLPPPMEEWEIDFGEIRLSHDTILEFFFVVDRGTSRLIHIEGGEGYHAETALEAVARVFVLHGLPKRLRLDRDTRFVASWTSDSYRRRVTSNGTIMIDKHVYYIGQDFAKQQVLVQVDAHQQQYYVTYDDQLIKKLDIAGLHHQPMDFQTYLVMMKAEARSIERHRMALWYKIGDAA